MAARTVSVFIATVPEGSPVGLPGIGQVKNGETRDLSDEQIALYEAAGFQFPESGNLDIRIEQSAPGPSQSPDTSRAVTEEAVPTTPDTETQPLVDSTASSSRIFGPTQEGTVNG